MNQHTRHPYIEQLIALPQTKRQHAASSIVLLVALGDCVVIALAALLSFKLRFSWFDNLGAQQIALEYYAIHLVSGSMVMALILYLNGMYQIEMLTRYRYGALRMIICAIYWALFFVSVSLFFKIDPAISRSWVMVAAALFGLGLVIWRFLFCRHIATQRLLESVRRQTLIVGWSPSAERFWEKSESCNNRGDFFPFKIDGLIPLKEEDCNSLESKIPTRGMGIETLEQSLTSRKYDTVIIGQSQLPMDQMLQLQELCGREIVDYMMIPDFVSTLSSCLHIESFRGMPLLTQTKQELNKTSSAVFKRAFDIAGACVGLMVSFPLIAWFAFKVKKESPGPIFYKQTRLGRNGKLFEIIKIRSMRTDAEAKSGAQWCKEDDPRRLEIGVFMRKYNIDELPQFWNVLKGEMSLVGPRPERPELIKDFKHEISYYNLRHIVKPGITGWAQINGWRGDTCLQSRIACDIEYIERWSLWLDLYICLRTINSNKNAY